MRLSMFLRILTTPACWMRNHGTNPALDAWMLIALKDPQISQISSYTCRLNGVPIWIANFPYCFGHVGDSGSLGLPSRSTCFRLYDAVASQQLKDLAGA
jgi:hypothetical protein